MSTHPGMTRRERRNVDFERAVAAAAAFVMGLAFGSFGNVVVWRFPRGESVSAPASHCPACENPIRWYDNVPVLSWILLRARCRDCGAAIPWRYPAVELLTALLWAFAVVEFGVQWQALVAIIMFYLLIILAFIDMDIRRLPNPIVFLLGVIGLAGAVISQVTDLDLVPLTPVAGALSAPLLAAVVGALSASGIALGIASLYSSVRQRAGLGMGDVKLLAALGPYLGVYTIGVLMLGSFLGAIWGIALASTTGAKGSTRFAFGPCLAAAAVIIAVAGPEMWAWYAGIAGLT